MWKNERKKIQLNQYLQKCEECKCCQFEYDIINNKHKKNIKKDDDDDPDRDYSIDCLE